MAIDPERLVRGLHLHAVRDGDGWRVGDRTVHPEAPAGEQCTCGDHRYRQSECKHLIRVVRLGALDAETIGALRALLPVPARRPTPGREP